jgi:hypothetical protein
MQNVADVERQFEHQRRGWVVERIGWIGLLLVLIAAALGAFGRGPLSQRTRVSKDGSLTVQYDAIGRSRAPCEVCLRWSNPPGAHEITVAISRGYLDRVTVKEIEPPPLTVEAAADEMRYRFLVNSESAQTEVRFRLHMETIGSAAATLTVADQQISIQQFVLP